MPPWPCRRRSRRWRPRGCTTRPSPPSAMPTRRWPRGDTGMLAESTIEPVNDLPRADDLPEGDPGDLGKAVMIKLNGGLGTSMGMTRAKSLVEVKDGLTFLDVIARQATTAGVPLLLMNSFRTRQDSLAVLERYPELPGDLPLDFIQNKEPKLDAELAGSGDLGGRPRAGVVPARPRRHLPGAGGLRTAGAAARSGLRDGVRLQRRQPGRHAGPAHPELVPGAGPAVPDGGLAPGRERPQGRAPGPPARRRPAGAARVRPDGGRGRGRLPGHHAPPLLQHQLAVDGPARAGRRARGRGRRAAVAADREPQDGGPRGSGLDPRDPAGDRDGCGRRRVRGRAGDRGRAATGSRR